MKKVLIFFICLVAFPMTSKAVGVCTTDQYKKQIEELNNVDISYTVQFNNNIPIYTITFKNLTNYMLIVYSNKFFSSNNGTYSYKVNTGGTTRYTIYSKACKTTSSIEPNPYVYKEITLPNYNKYSTREECNEFRENYICQKWSGYNVTENKFKEDINKLKEGKAKVKEEKKERIVLVKKKWYEYVREIISKLWWLFIILMILISGLVYSIKSKQKKNEFDFRL